MKVWQVANPTQVPSQAGHPLLLPDEGLSAADVAMTIVERFRWP